MPNKPFTVIAFDYGTKTIGAAVGQSLTKTANPLNAIKANDGVPASWQDIEKLLNEWQPKLCLVGLPLNMDGTESTLCIRVRKFANRLHGRFGLRVELVDERLSTRQAREELQHSGGEVDSQAAAIILRDYFSQLA